MEFQSIKNQGCFVFTTSVNTFKTWPYAQIPDSVFGDGSWGWMRDLLLLLPTHSILLRDCLFLFFISRISQVLYAFVSLWVDAKQGCFLPQAEKPLVSSPSRSRWHGAREGLLKEWAGLHNEIYTAWPYSEVTGEAFPTPTTCATNQLGTHPLGPPGADDP